MYFEAHWEGKHVHHHELPSSTFHWRLPCLLQNLDGRPTRLKKNKEPYKDRWKWQFRSKNVLANTLDVLFQPVDLQKCISDIQKTPTIVVDLDDVDFLQLDQVTETLLIFTDKGSSQQIPNSANKNICAYSDDQYDTDIINSSPSPFIETALNDYLFLP